MSIHSTIFRIALSVVLLTPSFLAAQCIDPDGDGYGTRNGRACRTRRTQTHSQTPNFTIKDMLVSDVDSSSARITATLSKFSSGRTEIATNSKFTGSSSFYTGFFRKKVFNQVFSNLTPNTTYYVRIRAWSGRDKVLSDVETFTTKAAFTPTSSTTSTTTTTTSSTTTTKPQIGSNGMLNLSAYGQVDDSFPLAFPGAMGGGKYASGGRGGKVVVVNTRTNDCDSSNSLTSLNEALSMTEPRYIVFAVDGIVELSGCGSVSPHSMKTLYMTSKNSNVTVACQTAPGKMVIRVSSLNHSDGMSNAIYRHCAFRGARVTGGGTRGNQRAVAIFPNKNQDSTDLIFDHNTFSWTDDDVFQIYISPTATGSAKNITVQHSIGAEGDSDSAAETSRSCNSGSGSTCKTKGQSWDAQSGGMNALGIGTNGFRVENTTFTHNFQAHNALRNCEFKGHVIAECSNNITYNWRTFGAIWQVGYRPVPTQLRGKNNLFVRGPATITSHGGDSSTCHGDTGSGVCPIFINSPSDNMSGSDIGDNYLQDTIGGDPSLGQILSQHPAQDSGTFTADSILTTVSENRSILSMAQKDSLHMSCIGASKPVRHQTDQRIIDEMYSGTGEIGIGEDIRSNTGVVNASTHDTVIQRDWSEFTAGPGHPASYDTDNDGMDDFWELDNGLTVGDRDHNDDLDSDGYTNIEEFFNYLARCSGV